MDKKEQKAVLEAVLFTMGEAVEIERLAAVLEISKKETKELLLEMKADYDKKDKGITLMELEDSFQMCTKSEMYEYLIKIAKTPIPSCRQRPHVRPAAGRRWERKEEPGRIPLEDTR